MKNFDTIKKELYDIYVTELGLPIEVLQRADEILDEAAKINFIEGRCYKTTVAGATLLATREQNVPRVAEDFESVTHKESNDITRYKISQRSKELKNKLNIGVTPTDTEAYLQYYLDELETGEETQRIAQQLLDSAEKEGIGKNAAPTSFAAGIIDAARIITDAEYLQTDIEEVTHVSTSQMRKYRKQMT